MHAVAAWNRLWPGTGMCDYMHEKWLICSVEVLSQKSTVVAKKKQWKQSTATHLSRLLIIRFYRLEHSVFSTTGLEVNTIPWSDTPPYSTFMIYIYIYIYFPTNDQHPVLGLQACKSLVQQFHAILTRGFLLHPIRFPLLRAALESLFFYDNSIL